MKKPLLITLISLFLFSVSYAQKEVRPSGVYMTFDDFKNGKLIKADDNFLGLKPQKHLVTMKTNHEEKEYKTDGIFGVLVNGTLYRFVVVNSVAIVCQMSYYTDDYIWWRHVEIENRTSRVTHGLSSFVKYKDPTNLYPDEKQTVKDYLSNKLDGELFFLPFGGTAESLLQHKGFKPLVDCIKSSKKRILLVAVGDCMAKDPTWKKTPEDAIPPVK